MDHSTLDAEAIEKQRTQSGPPTRMPNRPSDTHPDAERVQLGLLRKASVARRLDLTRSVSATAIALSRRAIARANPNLNDRDLDLLFVEYHHGADLAERLRSYLASR